MCEMWEICKHVRLRWVSGEQDDVTAGTDYYDDDVDVEEDDVTARADHDDDVTAGTDHDDVVEEDDVTGTDNHHVELDDVTAGADHYDEDVGEFPSQGRRETMVIIKLW